MSVVKTALMGEILERMEKSKEYYNLINTSKTKIKAKTYKKKLKQNNNILADLIISLDKVTESQYNTKNNNNNGDDIDVKREPAEYTN